MRKLQPPQVERVKNSKKQTTKHYKGRLTNTQNNSVSVALLLLEINNDL